MSSLSKASFPDSKQRFFWIYFRVLFSALLLPLALCLPLLPKAVLASKPVNANLVGCVMEGSFYSFGQPIFEHDLNRAQERYSDLVSGPPISDSVYRIHPEIEHYPHKLLDLSDYEGKALGIEGSLLPGDVFLVSNADSVTVLRDSCHENLLSVIAQRVDPESSPPLTEAAGEKAMEIEPSGQSHPVQPSGTDLPPGLVSMVEQDELTVRALRAWDELPREFMQLALDLQGYGIDLLDADLQEVQRLADRARSGEEVPDHAKPLERLAEYLAGFHDRTEKAHSDIPEQDEYVQPEDAEETRVLFAGNEQELWEPHEHALGRSPTSRRETYQFSDFAALDDKGLKVEIQDPSRTLAVGIQSSEPLVPVPRLDEDRTALVTFVFDPEHTDHAVFALVADNDFPSSGALRGSAVNDHAVQVQLERRQEFGYRCKLSIQGKDSRAQDFSVDAGAQTARVTLALRPDGGVELRDVQGRILLAGRLPDPERNPAPAGWHPHAVAAAPEEGVNAGLALKEVLLACEDFEHTMTSCTLKPPHVQKLFHGREIGVHWDKWTDGEDDLTRYVQIEDGALKVEIPAGEDSARLGIATPEPEVWPVFAEPDASATLVLDLDARESTGLGVVLSTQGTRREDPDRSSRFKLEWRGNEAEVPGVRAQQLEGSSPQAQIKLPDGEGEGAEDALPGLPREIRLELTPGNIRVLADGFPAESLEWPELQNGQPLRAWIYALPASETQSSRLGLHQVRLECQPGSEKVVAGPAPGVDPLPMTTNFSGEMGEAWEPSTRSGRSSHFDSDTKFTPQGMQVAIEASEVGSGLISGIRSAERLLEIDDRVEETPFRLRFNVNPQDFTGMEVWLARSRGRTESNLESDQVHLVRHQDGRLADHLEIRINSRGRETWSRLMDPEQVEQHWDGTVNIDLSEDWIRAELPGVAALRAPFGVRSSEPHIAVRSRTATRRGIPARLHLHSIDSGWVTPPGMDAIQRERLTDLEDFDPEMFLEALYKKLER